MIFTQENEYSAVLDACVLVPAALCDLLLRLAEEPAMYRPLWSEHILAEMASAMEKKLSRTAKEIRHKQQEMNRAFPEAMVTAPKSLVRCLDGIPDENDRPVLAVAIMARANVIVTQNTKHFPMDCLEEYGILCHNADDFLIHQYHLCGQIMLDKLDDQAAGISKTRAYVINSLKNAAPGFAQLVEAHTL
ncbi:MAG: PIN domain-containing protein [Candidatus Sulfotelmatobacter sp.]|jgi:predicted nucleic acid-binding protein